MLNPQSIDIYRFLMMVLCLAKFVVRSRQSIVATRTVLTLNCHPFSIIFSEMDFRPILKLPLKWASKLPGSHTPAQLVPSLCQDVSLVRQLVQMKAPLNSKLPPLVEVRRVWRELSPSWQWGASKKAVSTGNDYDDYLMAF